MNECHDTYNFYCWQAESVVTAKSGLKIWKWEPKLILLSWICPYYIYYSTILYVSYISILYTMYTYIHGGRKVYTGIMLE